MWAWRPAIVPLFPETVVQWDREVTPGVSLPMYEGARVCGHGTVIWRADMPGSPLDATAPTP
jgi:hypothetical protein